MTGRARTASIDLAWSIALAGIVAGPTVLAGTPHTLELLLLDGPPVALAAVLAGVAAAAIARPRLLVGNRAGAAKAMLSRGLWLAIIAATLLLLDLLLEQASGFWSLLRVWLVVAGLPVGELWVPSVQDPLLVPLGAAILLAAPLVAAPAWAVGVGAAVLAGVGWWAPTGERIVAALPAEWDLALAEALVGPGARSASALAVQVLVGILVGRWLASGEGRGGAREPAAALLGIGAATAVAGAVASGSLPGDAALTAQLVGSTGVALGALAIVALADGAVPLAGRRRLSRALAPILAVGAAPFTAVMVHALLLATLRALPEAASWAVLGWSGWLVQLAALLALGALLATLDVPGPVERFLLQQGERFGGYTIARPSMPYLLPDEHSLAWGVRLAAPVDEVWRATTDPPAVADWLPDPLQPISRSIMDVRPGGGYRHEHADGSLVVGEYLRVEPPRLSVERMQVVGTGRAPVLSVTTLREVDGDTVLECHERYESRALRDSAIELGLPFATASVLRLAAHLERRGARVDARERWVRPEPLRIR